MAKSLTNRLGLRARPSRLWNRGPSGLAISKELLDRYGQVAQLASTQAYVQQDQHDSSVPQGRVLPHGENAVRPFVLASRVPSHALSMLATCSRLRGSITGSEAFGARTAAIGLGQRCSSGSQR